MGITSPKFEILNAVLNAYRQSRKSTTVKGSPAALEEMLEAVQIAGYVLVPRGLVTAMKNVLEQIEHEVIHK